VLYLQGEKPMFHNVRMESKRRGGKAK